MAFQYSIVGQGFVSTRTSFITNKQITQQSVISQLYWYKMGRKLVVGVLDNRN